MSNKEKRAYIRTAPERIRNTYLKEMEETRNFIMSNPKIFKRISEIKESK